MRKLLEWKYINPPANNTSSNYQNQTDKYKKLLAKIDTDNICKYTVNELTDRILDITADTKFKTGLKIKIVYKPYVPCYLDQVNEHKELSDLAFEDVLEILEIAAIIKDTNLQESYSMASDFKLYENLWN
jgi:hypothetical protein